VTGAVCQASDAIRAAASLGADETGWRALLRDRRAPRRTDAAHRLVLLGTAGGANPKSTRCGYSNAVVAGDAAYLVDLGEGAHAQTWRAGLALNPVYDAGARPLVRNIFLTHLHADHIMDLVNVFVGSWPPPVVDVVGPAPAGLPIPEFPPGAGRPLVFPELPTPGTRDTVDLLLRAFAYNINLRVFDEGRSPVTDAVRVREMGVRRDGYVPDIDFGVSGDGSTPAAAAPEMEPVVIHPEDDHGVQVSAILVQHAPVFPAFGYRFDTPAGSVVFSGDTGPCENVVRLARGADILVHETIDVDALMWRLTKLPNYDAVRNHLSSAHSAPEDVGAIAKRAGVGTLVLSHLVPGDGEVPEDQWEARARSTFDGEVLCGVDLDELGLG
jgi:ribonuclease BN (tRNA processing enzyme)